MLSKLIVRFKSRQFFSLPGDAKAALFPTPWSFRGYFGMKAEKIRGHTSMKENFDFGNPKDDALGSWPNEEQLPEFRNFAAEFYQVYTLAKRELPASNKGLGLY
jgi:isopenicillin N synthase-like dioxygenase